MDLFKNAITFSFSQALWFSSLKGRGEGILIALVCLPVFLAQMPIYQSLTSGPVFTKWIKLSKKLA